MRELNIDKVEIITAKHLQMYISKLISRELAPANQVKANKRAVR